MVRTSPDTQPLGFLDLIVIFVFEKKRKKGKDKHMKRRAQKKQRMKKRKYKILKCSFLSFGKNLPRHPAPEFLRFSSDFVFEKRKERKRQTDEKKKGKRSKIMKATTQSRPLAAKRYNKEELADDTAPTLSKDQSGHFDKLKTVFVHVFASELQQNTRTQRHLWTEKLFRRTK